MPTYSFTNARGTGPRGVNRMSGAVALVQVGETRELPVHSREIDGLDAYFDIEMVSDEPFDPVVPEADLADPLDHDRDGHKGGSAVVSEADDAETSTVALMLESSAEDVATFVDGADCPSDAVLREYIERKTGKKAHPNAKTATLVEKAKEAAAAA